MFIKTQSKKIISAFIVLSVSIVGLSMLSLPAFSCEDHKVGKNAVWIDVRSDFEHKVSHIEGDVHIPHQSILEEVSLAYPDKNTEIHVYCLSGGRSGKALSELTAAGYTNVKNAGGISDVRKVRNLAE